MFSDALRCRVTRLLELDALLSLGDARNLGAAKGNLLGRGHAATMVFLVTEPELLKKGDKARVGTERVEGAVLAQPALPL